MTEEQVKLNSEKERLKTNCGYSIVSPYYTQLKDT